jgi:hypothetical protein
MFEQVRAKSILAINRVKKFGEDNEELIVDTSKKIIFGVLREVTVKVVAHQLARMINEYLDSEDENEDI